MWLQMAALSAVGIILLFLWFFWLMEERKNRKIKLMIGILLCVLLACTNVFFYRDLVMMERIKRIVLITILTAAAFIDGEKKLIPNRLLAAGTGIRLLLLAAEVVLEKETVLATAVSAGIAAAGIFLLCMVFLLIMKNSIGMGDVKLFMVMGLYLGIEDMGNAMMSSLIIIFFYAVFLLVTKKKGRRDTIPFAPAILIGTWLSIFLTGR